MTNNETIARRFLEACVVSGFLNPFDFGPDITGKRTTLSDQECQDIAINFPFSYGAIRSAFPKPKPTEQWKTFKVGDIVTRIGTDEQEIIDINPSGDLITVKCIKRPHDDFCEVGEIESNIPWRYEFVR